MSFTPLNLLLFLIPKDEQEQLERPSRSFRTRPQRAKRACLLLQTNRIPVLKASQTAKPIFGFLKHKQLVFFENGHIHCATMQKY